MCKGRGATLFALPQAQVNFLAASAVLNLIGDGAHKLTPTQPAERSTLGISPLSPPFAQAAGRPKPDADLQDSKVKALQHNAVPAGRTGPRSRKPTRSSCSACIGSPSSSVFFSRWARA